MSELPCLNLVLHHGAGFLFSSVVHLGRKHGAVL